MNEPITDTPFRMVGNEENGFFIALANYRLCEPRKTIDEAYETMENEKWHYIVRLVDAIQQIKEKYDLEEPKSQKISELKPI